MKKFLFFVILLFVGLGASAQIKVKRDTIIVDGFSGNKPLKENTDVPVRFSTDPHSDVFLLEAYKGETKQKFIARIKSYQEKKYQPVYKTYKSKK